MIDAERETGLPGAGGPALEARLAGWATRHQLPPERAQAIRLEVLRAAPAAPVQLGYAWWTRFFAETAAVARRAADVHAFLPTPGESRRTLSPALL